MKNKLLIKPEDVKPSDVSKVLATFQLIQYTKNSLSVEIAH